VNSDDSVRRLKGSGRPLNPAERRMAVLAGLEAVDWVVCFDEDTPRALLQVLQPDLLVKGGDYPGKQAVGGGLWRRGAGAGPGGQPLDYRHCRTHPG
jgi:D-beta-D-heptose 7-phosphate kinase/D-beta-D-heptose 1-phosphate adenosyltransferase